MSFINQPTAKNQPIPLNFLEIIAIIEQPRFHNKKTGWQAASIKLVKAEGIEISSITGTTPLTLSRFMRVKVRGFVKVNYAKYEIAFIKCEEVPVPSQPCRWDRLSGSLRRSELSIRMHYVLLILRHGRRQILWLGVTAHPTAE